MIHAGWANLATFIQLSSTLTGMPCNLSVLFVQVSHISNLQCAWHRCRAIDISSVLVWTKWQCKFCQVPPVVQTDVDRWLTEAGRKVGGHLPWGGGPRMCLGFNFAQLEIKVCVLTRLLARCRVY